MTFRTIQQEVDELFDRADHPNIAHKDDIDIQFLVKMEKFLPVPQIQSVLIMKDVLEAIIYVSSHLIIYKPCQVFKEHIIQKYSKWGLCNIICYRDPGESQQFDPNRYWPIDYNEHPDEDSQLIWSLGRLWFQILTCQRIPAIRSLNQKELQQLVDANVKDMRIKSLLKQILVIDRNKRLDLVTLIKHGLFEYQQKSKIYLHSVIPNLSQVQQISRIVTTNRFQSHINTGQAYNPFQQQLFKRDFKQCITMVDLFQKVKQFIFNNFQVQQNSHQIHFSCFLIDAFSYLRLKGFKLRQQQNQFFIVLYYDKHDYTRYLQKFFELQDKIERKRKMKKFQKFRERFPTLLQAPSGYSRLDEQHIYYHFKTYMMRYAKYYKQRRMSSEKGMDCKSYVRLIQMMLVRASNYVFTNCRKFVFGDFIKNNEKFQLPTILANIQKCQDVKLLEKLEKTILDLYFPNKNQ